MTWEPAEPKATSIERALARPYAQEVARREEERRARIRARERAHADALVKLQAAEAADIIAPEVEPERPPEEPKTPNAIALRLLRGREAGARAGRVQSGPCPFGYRRDYSRRNKRVGAPILVVHEPEAEIVRLIFREYLRLRSMKKLIKLLEDLGHGSRRGKRWSRAGIAWILKNDTYRGRVHFGAIRTRGEHEAIVAPIVFNKAQALILANDKRGLRRLKTAATGTTEGGAHA